MQIKNRLLCSAFTSLLALAAGLPLLAAEKFTYVDLVKRLTDLEQLAVLPQPGERCIQWSSYDRASRYDAAAGKYVGWDANGDGNGIIRKEDGKEVFAEMEGPGCIWRIWSANPKGRIRFYFDGATTPSLEFDFNDLFTFESIAAIIALTA